MMATFSENSFDVNSFSADSFDIEVSTNTIKQNLIKTLYAVKDFTKILYARTNIEKVLRL